METDTFFAALTKAAPTVAAAALPRHKASIDDLLVLLAASTAVAIEKTEWATVKAHFAFISAQFDAGNAELKNAVYVSYLEELFLGEDKYPFSTARALLPTQLLFDLIDLEVDFSMQDMAAH